MIAISVTLQKVVELQERSLVPKEVRVNLHDIYICKLLAP